MGGGWRDFVHVIIVVFGVLGFVNLINVHRIFTPVARLDCVGCETEIPIAIRGHRGARGN